MFLRLLTLLAAATVAVQAAAPSQWDWVSPLPHRQSWVDLASGTNGFVALTDGYGDRQIYHSADGDQWELALTPNAPHLSHVVFANDKYIAVGYSEAVVTSADGIDWQVVHTNATGTVLFDIAYGNGAYVAVGYNSTAFYSKDLKIWSPLDFPKGNSLLSIEYGNGIFLAVANSGKLYRSADGRIWTEAPWPSGIIADYNGYDFGLAFNNGVFAFGSRNGGAVSTDGLNWTVTTTKSYRKIVAAGSGFIGTTGLSLGVSSDGTDWQTVVSLDGPMSDEFFCAAKFGDRWLAGGYCGILYTSTDGAQWSPLSKPIDYSHGNVAYANGRFIRYGADAGQYVSSDGADWNFNTNAPGLITLTSSAELAVGITSENTAAISSDGTNWQEFTLPAHAHGRIISGNGTFIVAADAGVLLSRDGKTWDYIQIPDVNSVRLIGFQNGIFAAISDAARPMSSADGRTWTIAPAQYEATAQFYAAGNGLFVGIADGGMGPGSVTISSDGINWHRQRLGSGSTYSYTGLEFGGGYFVMIDGAGGIYYSSDAVNWVGDRQAPQPFTGAAYGNGVWIVAGGDSILRSSDRVAAQSVATLQLTKNEFASWSLLVSGSPGERWQIQSSAGVGADWTNLQMVEIPSPGKILVPLNLNNPAGFFRAIIAP